MTDDEVRDFFREYVYGFMFTDLAAVIGARANFGAALMMFNYTEFLGGIANGHLGQGGVSAACFADGLRLMRWKNDAKYYVDFVMHMRDGGAPSSAVAPYKVFRCGLAHEYFVKGMATIRNDPSNPAGSDSNTPGYGWDSGRLFVYTNGYCRDLRAAFQALEVDVVAGAPARGNFEAAVGRVEGRTVSASP